MIGVEEARRRAAEYGKRLDPRQRKFVELIMAGKSGKEAATEAGYSAKSAESRASKLLAMEKIIDYRSALTDLAAASLGVSEGWVLSKLVSVAERCMQAEPHQSWNSETHQYEDDGLFVFDANGSIRSLTAIAKLIGAGEETAKVAGTLEEYLRTLEEKA